MLAEAHRKADERGVAVEWMQGDMRAFDLGRTFDFVFIAANSLLHLHEAEDLVSCFRSVRRHLAPGARFVFDVFNPSVRLLAEADGVRRTRESLSFMDGRSLNGFHTGGESARRGPDAARQGGPHP